VRLTQAVFNLLHNASRYTPEGGCIAVAAAPRDGAAVIEVSDTGMGIAPDQLESIFELFAQGRQGDAQGGLGIGLTLVRRLVVMHGGSVVAASAGPGMGSRFTIRLPLATAVGAAPAAPAGGASPAPQRRRVLVVDDDRDSAESMVLLLRTLGHDARACYRGEEALAILPHFRPELVLLDIGLPGIDGYEVARRLRETRVGAALVLAAMSGFGTEEDLRRARAAGFDHHLLKPVDAAALRTLLAPRQP
jgi:CheY-like chemotaxis protein